MIIIYNYTKSINCLPTQHIIYRDHEGCMKKTKKIMKSKIHTQKYTDVLYLSSHHSVKAVQLIY